MKKVLSVFAVVVMSVGLFSCEADSSVEETQALYELEEVDATDDDSVEETGREN